jgi:4,5-DOPA dioxygenase extradiol
MYMMPVVFIGHGSPMNALSDNEITKEWVKIAELIPRPTAILSISAHWFTKGSRVSVVENPKTIHDFYGFPKALFDFEYKAKGSPFFAGKTLKLLEDIAVADEYRGLDHGTWSVLNIMYTKADIPVFQLSVDSEATPERQFEIGKMLSPLRDSNVFILGSGNVVHNAGAMDFNIKGGFEWASRFDNYVKEKVLQRDFTSLFKYRQLGDIARYAVPTADHLSPLFYILGAIKPIDKILIANNVCMAGSLSMTSYVFF